jgi:hypothetical protein
LLTGAVIGQATGSPPLALIGGLVSHIVLDIIPHTEGDTFRGEPALNPVQTSAPVLRQACRGRRRLLSKHHPVPDWRSALRANVLRTEILEAGVEFAAGVLAVGWLVGTCPQAQGLAVGLGAVGGILPDLIDAPLRRLVGIAFFHPSGFHGTVGQRHAVWGILTQVATAGIAAAYLWRASGC